MIFLYLLVLGILFFSGYQRKDSIPLLHATYCRCFYGGIYWFLEKNNVNTPQNRLLAILYGGQKMKTVTRLHISLKLSSCYLFLLLPVLLMTFNQTTGTVDMLFALFMTFLGYYLPELDLRIRQIKKSEQILYDFSRFCYRLSLYVNSGLTMQQAFKRSILHDRESHFYMNADQVIKKSEGGNIFLDELLSFSERMACSEINSLVSLLCQNIKNGGEIKEKLNEFSEQMWIKRRNLALKKGEQASVKMVFPLTLGLVGVILILVTPAIMLIKQI
ncbi:MAG: type II secretion system F family protein [Clostridia bacterium]|nr:type II secretion system F family protein [Clostridia bacterium]